jgi:hypothetical protein
MFTIRSVATVVAIAAMTSAAALTLFWPKATLAEDDDTTAQLTQDGTKVNHVVVSGEVVRDKKAKSGWVLEITAENRGDQEETAELETDLTRQVSNPMSRSSPMPTAVWKKKETITVAAGEKVVRRYDVPSQIAVQIAAAKNAEAAHEKAVERANAKGLPYPMPRAETYFGVAFKGQWSDDSGWNRGRPGRGLAMAPPAPIDPFGDRY